MEYDIICVGTGISALYMGYQMYRAKSEQSILFIEKDVRVGGRIHSIPISPDIKYYAEGCAQRFFTDNSPLLINLLQTLGIGTTAVSNNNIRTGKEYEQLLDTLEAYLSPESKDLCTYSFPDSLIAATGKKESVDIFSSSIGYALFKYPINMDMAYRTLLSLTQSMQNLINGGFVSICIKLYDILRKKYRFLFGSTVRKVSYSDSIYIINDIYRCRKIVMTGTREQLNAIDIQIPSVVRTREIMDRVYFDFIGIRIYLYIPNPWWDTSQIFYKFNTGGPLNQVVYYSNNTILVYSNMESANILLNMVPIDFRYKDMKWYKSSILKVLVWYIMNLITDGHLYGSIQREIPAKYRDAYLAARNNPLGSVSHIAFKYTKSASQFVKPVPISLYSNIFESIRENNGFFIVGGDYTRDPGWVESCLRSVHMVLKDIQR